jgi:hypothetical protein
MNRPPRYHSKINHLRSISTPGLCSVFRVKNGAVPAFVPRISSLCSAAGDRARLCRGRRRRPQTLAEAAAVALAGCKAVRARDRRIPRRDQDRCRAGVDLRRLAGCLARWRSASTERESFRGPCHSRDECYRAEDGKLRGLASLRPVISRNPRMAKCSTSTARQCAPRPSMLSSPNSISWSMAGVVRLARALRRAVATLGALRHISLARTCGSAYSAAQPSFDAPRDHEYPKVWCRALSGMNPSLSAIIKRLRESPIKQGLTARQRSLV